MATLSARARNELDRLRAGAELTAGECKVTLSEGGLARIVLDELIRLYQSDATGASNEDARALLDSVWEQAERGPATARVDTSVLHEDSVTSPGEGVGRWRLHQLNAHNYRCLTEWDGEDFQYDFAGKPHHIYGPNGSGKTSILGAVVWCLTGYCLRERAEPETAVRGVPLYDEDYAGSTADAWPEVVTLPVDCTLAEIADLEPACWVEVELRSGERGLRIKRAMQGRGAEATLEICEGEECYGSLAEVGISDTDCELTMLMPARVSALEFRPGSKFSDNLLAVSALDALRDIGDLARRLRKSLRTLGNRWRELADDSVAKARDRVGELMSRDAIDDELKALLDEVEGNCEQREEDTDAAYLARLYRAQSEAVKAKAVAQFGEIEAAVALPSETPAQRQPMSAQERDETVRALTRAGALIQGQSVAAWEPLSDWLSLETETAPVLDKVEERAEQIHSDLLERHELWVQNIETAGKLDLKIRAGQYLQEIGQFEDCPVCEQDLPESIKTQLQELASKTTADTDSLKTYVEEQVAALRSLLPPDVLSLEAAAPDVQAKSMLQEGILTHTRDLGGVHQEAERECTRMVNALPEYEETQPRCALTSEDWNPEFVRQIRDLKAEYENIVGQCAVGTWAREHAESALERTEPLVQEITDNLARLESYGRRYSSLVELAKDLEEPASRCEQAEVMLHQRADADTVSNLLTDMAELDAYANACLHADLGNVGQTMQEYYSILYPKDPVQLAGLVNRATRKGAAPDYGCVLRWSDELLADADPVSNAGRIRGLLWSYTFALIEEHSPSFDLIALDDPYISLDDYAAQKMMTEVLINRVGEDHQFIATSTDRSLVAPLWARDREQERMAAIHVLHRGPNHRSCRIRPGVDPLRKAVEAYQADPEEFEDVVQETRKYLERNFKLLAEYVLDGVHASEDFRQLLDWLMGAAQNGNGTTPLGLQMQSQLRLLLEAIGVDFSVSPPVVPEGSLILHALHHGGPDESRVTTAHAECVADTYPRWADAFAEVFAQLDELLGLAQRAAVVRGEDLRAAAASDLPLVPTRFDKPILEIAQVAAEGGISTEGMELGEPSQHPWPQLEFGQVVTDVCEPVVRPGQIAVFAPSCPVKNGDLALIQSTNECRLRRVFRVQLEGEDGGGWVAVPVSALVRDVAPIVTRGQGLLLRKLVGVLYTARGEQALRSAPRATDVVTVESPWPDVLAQLHAGKMELIRVSGDSAEPVALDGQFLVVMDVPPTDIRDNSLCCVWLDNGAMVIKRFARSGSDEGRVLLQPINQASGYSIIEASLQGSSTAQEVASTALPHIEEMRLVRGVLFDAPESLDDSGATRP